MASERLRRVIRSVNIAAETLEGLTEYSATKNVEIIDAQNEKIDNYRECNGGGNLIEHLKHASINQMFLGIFPYKFNKLWLSKWLRKHITLHSIATIIF